MSHSKSFFRFYTVIFLDNINKNFVELYKDMMAEFPGLYVTASGGVSCMQDVQQLEAAGVPSVIMGKAIYEGRITFYELEKHQLSVNTI